MADAERKTCRRGGRKETNFRSNGAIARRGISKTDSNVDTDCGGSCLSCIWAGYLVDQGGRAEQDDEGGGRGSRRSSGGRRGHDSRSTVMMNPIGVVDAADCGGR
eukprot:5454582-Prymnesium_polylepis.1